MLYIYMYIHTSNVNFYASKDVHYLFYEVQTTILTFVDTKMRYT